MSLLDAARCLPAVNASLNALAAVLLVYGWAAIRRGDVRSHRRLANPACYSDPLHARGVPPPEAQWPTSSS